MKNVDYSGLSADDITAQYGDLLEKQMKIMRDKNTGVLRTLFNMLAFRLPQAANWRAMHDAMLEKNGVEKIQADVCYDYLPDVIAAVEGRGSKAATKLSAYYQFMQDTKVLAQAIKNPPRQGFLASISNNYERMATSIKASKLLP